MYEICITVSQFIRSNADVPQSRQEIGHAFQPLDIPSDAPPSYEDVVTSVSGQLPFPRPAFCVESVSSWEEDKRAGLNLEDRVRKELARLRETPAGAAVNRIPLSPPAVTSASTSNNWHPGCKPSTPNVLAEQILFQIGSSTTGDTNVKLSSTAHYRDREQVSREPINTPHASRHTQSRKGKEKAALEDLLHEYADIDDVPVGEAFCLSYDSDQRVLSTFNSCSVPHISVSQDVASDIIFEPPEPQKTHCLPYSTSSSSLNTHAKALSTPSVASQANGLWTPGLLDRTSPAFFDSDFSDPAVSVDDSANFDRQRPVTKSVGRRPPPIPPRPRVLRRSPPPVPRRQSPNISGPPSAEDVVDDAVSGAESSMPPRRRPPPPPVRRSRRRARSPPSNPNPEQGLGGHGDDLPLDADITVLDHNIGSHESRSATSIQRRGRMDVSEPSNSSGNHHFTNQFLSPKVSIAEQLGDDSIAVISSHFTPGTQMSTLQFLDAPVTGTPLVETNHAGDGNSLEDSVLNALAAEENQATFGSLESMSNDSLLADTRYRARDLTANSHSASTHQHAVVQTNDHPVVFPNNSFVTGIEEPVSTDLDLLLHRLEHAGQEPSGLSYDVSCGCFKSRQRLSFSLDL